MCLSVSCLHTVQYYVGVPAAHCDLTYFLPTFHFLHSYPASETTALCRFALAMVSTIPLQAAYRAESCDVNLRSVKIPLFCQFQLELSAMYALIRKQSNVLCFVFFHAICHTVIKTPVFSTITSHHYSHHTFCSVSSL